VPENSIEVRQLTRRFGKFTAVDRVSFAVAKGEVFGFLGANGAGKSTTIRMLCGLLTPTSGSARVAGHDISTEPERVKENIGYMSQKFSLYEDLTVEENIHFYGGVYGLKRGRLKARMPWALEMAGLQGKEHLLARELAGGWKQRLALGCALLHEPKVVFLDEPTGGVDPVSRRRFWDLINNLAESGVTVFVTTHYLDEAEYCNRIMLMHAGSIIAGGSPRELKTQYLLHPILEVECDRAVEAMAILETQLWVLGISLFGNRIHITVEDEKTGREQTAAVLAGQGLSIERIERILPTLEDVFIHLIEEKQGTSPAPPSSSRSKRERRGEG